MCPTQPAPRLGSRAWDPGRRASQGFVARAAGPGGSGSGSPSIPSPSAALPPTPTAPAQAFDVHVGTDKNLQLIAPKHPLERGQAPITQGRSPQSPATSPNLPAAPHARPLGRHQLWAQRSHRRPLRETWEAELPSALRPDRSGSAAVDPAGREVAPLHRPCGLLAARPGHCGLVLGLGAAALQRPPDTQRAVMGGGSADPALALATCAQPHSPGGGGGAHPTSQMTQSRPAEEPDFRARESGLRAIL